jgi:nitrile hydratase accessory protein
LSLPSGLPDGGPAFAEPWQAEAYAMAQTLMESGGIAASDWAAAFGAALRKAADRGAADDSETYYAALVEALISVLVGEGRLDAEDIARRVEDWRAAYLRTPHGKPVTLAGP